MDDLDVDRELQSALAVEPSPEFVARVRARIAEEPRPSHIAGLLKPAAVIACVVILVVAWREDARLKPRSPEVGANHSGSVASPPPLTADLKVSTTKTASTTKTGGTNTGGTTTGVMPTFRSARAPQRTLRPAALAKAGTAAEPPMPEVIIAPDDIKALQQFVASANALRFAPLDDTPASTSPIVTALTIPPLTISPLDPEPSTNN